ncbi:CRISPR-associated protein Cas1 [Megasphaera cerevisiae DSM 20462]|jgi:CRISPR-associated protein Cas1|uniref:CRISPR-associated endonuclease Cas1 n=2 Tax=Megasphaera TaxID=906 RepID=A0A0J6WXX8_9FIRM|nr:CRISPR-associated protein Cas1 [Megasphaera cerevisiae DSM 20462]OKY53819.1 subtype I-C CRISPR-associated endonuclease Cas1 [Megasphaera cerevisiae]SJZ37381.1 CRISPR-associated protein, Cas1 family [Megasphaera cerevisiae DSM 20462]
MRHLLNTLFVTSQEIYLSLENENIVAWKGNQIVQRLPLLNLENILYFGHKGASPALLGACAKRNIGFCFFDMNGRFLARVSGTVRGNVLLRKMQYRLSDSDKESCGIARFFIMGKILNARTVLMRMARDHPLSVDQEKFTHIIKMFLRSASDAQTTSDTDELRGIEGNAAQLYFSVFDQLILQNKKSFYFQRRIKRPPADFVNAMLSFTYTILAHDCASALEGAGLDSYVGFLHRDRPGRESLALDLMEELRSIYADRFVLTLINNRLILPVHFQKKENGAVWLNDDGRKVLLAEWQKKKQTMIVHPFLQEKIYWGLIPYVQALLLARYIRGDMDGYPAFVGR